MGIKSQLGLLLLSIFFFVWLIQKPVNRLGVRTPYLSAPSQGQQLTADELNEFLDLWARINHGPLKKYFSQISLKSDSRYPQKIVTWLKLQNWNVERFFYDEQRLLELLEYVKLQKNINNNMELAKKTGADLDGVIKEQRRYLKAHTFGPEEIELVKHNLYQINEIFAGRAVPAKP